MAGLVQKSTRVSTFGGSSVAPSLTGTTAGNLATITVYYTSDTQATAPAAPSGWSVAIAPTPVTPGVSGAQWHTGAAIYYKENIAGGTLSATVASTGTCAIDAVMEEWGYTGTGLLDKTTSGSSTPTVTSGNTGTSAVTSQANELVIVCMAGPQVNVSANHNITNPPTGYTSLDVSNNSNTDASGEAAYLEVTSTGTQTAAWTWTTGGEFMGVLATFKGAAGAAPILMGGMCL